MSICCHGEGIFDGLAEVVHVLRQDSTNVDPPIQHVHVVLLHQVFTLLHYMGWRGEGRVGVRGGGGVEGRGVGGEDGVRGGEKGGSDKGGGT